MILAFSASFFFKTELVHKNGYVSVLYTSTGTVITCLMYDGYKCYASWKQNGVFWNNQNVIVDKKLVKSNLLGFIGYCMMQVLILNMVMFTIYFSVLADLNTGIGTSIWALTPFMMSLGDHLFFGHKLKYNHVVGITLIITCVILISLRD